MTVHGYFPVRKYVIYFVLCNFIIRIDRLLHLKTKITNWIRRNAILATAGDSRGNGKGNKTRHPCVTIKGIRPIHNTPSNNKTSPYYAIMVHAYDLVYELV